jgi:hypothetical protein
MVDVEPGRNFILLRVEASIVLHFVGLVINANVLASVDTGLDHAIWAIADDSVRTDLLKFYDILSIDYFENEASSDEQFCITVLFPWRLYVESKYVIMLRFDDCA